MATRCEVRLTLRRVERLSICHSERVRVLRHISKRDWCAGLLRLQGLAADDWRCRHAQRLLTYFTEKVSFCDGWRDQVRNDPLNLILGLRPRFTWRLIRFRFRVVQVFQAPEVARRTQKEVTVHYLVLALRGWAVSTALFARLLIILRVSVVIGLLVRRL